MIDIFLMNIEIKIFLNGRCAKKQRPPCRPVLRIVIGLNFVSVNGGDKIIINKNTLRDLLPTDIGYSRYSSQDVFDENIRYFNRPPRKCIKIENQIIEVEGPPIPLSRGQLPLVLRMGSSMVSGLLAGIHILLQQMGRVEPLGHRPSIRNINQRD